MPPDSYYQMAELEKLISLFGIRCQAGYMWVVAYEEIEPNLEKTFFFDAAGCHVLRIKQQSCTSTGRSYWILERKWSFWRETVTNQALFACQVPMECMAEGGGGPKKLIWQCKILWMDTYLFTYIPFFLSKYWSYQSMRSSS